MAIDTINLNRMNVGQCAVSIPCEADISEVDSRVILPVVESESRAASGGVTAIAGTLCGVGWNRPCAGRVSVQVMDW